MKRKIILLLLAVTAGICGANAQTLTIHNQTNCLIMIYSGHITVAGTTYSFGSEDPAQGSLVPGNATVIFTTQTTPPPLPPGQQKIVTCFTCPPIPYNPTATQYIDFKFRQPNMGSGAGYISAANPNTVSSPPVGCNNNQPYHVVWTGAAANPVINILP